MKLWPGSPRRMPDMAPRGFLRTVLDLKRRDIEAAKKRNPLSACRDQAEKSPSAVNLAEALSMSRPGNAGIIAEIKKASPSKGDIRLDLDPGNYAKTYTDAGARAISVLTEEHFFKGSLEDLRQVRAMTHLPVLRKDFTISSYQIYEARAAGADSVLLIVSILSRDQLRDYTCLARDLGMEPLVEIHSEWEFERAIACDAKAIGINNRNLETLETDLEVSRRLSPFFLAQHIPVEASGISSPADIRKGLGSGYCNFLVGESIVRAEDTGAFIRELIETDPGSAADPSTAAAPGRNPLKKQQGRTLVKICGLTDGAEARECAALGADAIGLVFYPDSPRNITTRQAVDICRTLPPGIITTGVFVNASMEFIMDQVKACSLKAVQLHGRETPRLAEDLAAEGLLVIKALFAQTSPYFDETASYPHASAFLAEHGKGRLPGGNAQIWNWEDLNKINRDKAVFLAGGLDPDNVARAIAAVNPDGVDVSSGVERAPGKKDMDKVRAFLNQVRGMK